MSSTTAAHNPATDDDPSDRPPRVNSWRNKRTIAVGAALGVALVVAGGFGVTRPGSDPDRAATAGVPTGSVDAGQDSAAFVARVGGSSLADTIERFKGRTEAVPGDFLAWATLGIAYVQQAHAVGDANLYHDAQAALDRSIEIDDTDNYIAYAGLAALAAGKHDFVTAERFALRGLDINPDNATLWGVLSDAQIQLGRYDEGFASVQRMVDLSPDTASLARVSYTHELRGDIDQAEALMVRALDAAASPGDKAFAKFQLGELKLREGDPSGALTIYNEALRESPENVSLLSGKAHALKVMGQTLTSTDVYQELVDKAPLADFLIEFGNFMELQGNADRANELYDQARRQMVIDAQNGVQADAGIILFEADHGDPAKALADAELGVQQRPFFEMHEAHAWALYTNGRYDEAAEAIDLAMEVGIQDAMLYVRSGLIEHARGDDAAAIDDMRTALSINPTIDQRADDLLAELVVTELG